MSSGSNTTGSSSTDIVTSGAISKWGWDYGLTDPLIATPWPNQANYFSTNGLNDAAVNHWTVAVESENAPGASSPGPADQSFQINDISKAPGSNGGVSTIQVVPGPASSGPGSVSVELKTDLYDNPQSAGPGYYTWYAFGLNTALGGGSIPPPNIAEFDANLFYNAWLPNAGARVSVDYQGWWNNRSFEFEIDLNRQSTDWGPFAGALVQDVQQSTGFTYVHINGAALGLTLLPGVETHVHINWGTVIQTLIEQGAIAAPVGGWSNSAGQAAYVSTELCNHAIAGSGVTDVWVNGFAVTGNAAGDPSALTPLGGDTMYSATSSSAGVKVTDSQTGAVTQTLALVPSDTMQFMSVDGRKFGTNLASARSLGLDPSQLCDYNGNHLGAIGNWVLLGVASVQPGAAPSYILTNPTSGRWAEVAVQPNGSINYQNYGQNGDTRVVGTYSDPLIALGLVVAGGPDDSQAAFTADVKGNDLNLLGSVYDQQNGAMDLMFDLKSAPGYYLRAILHTDGNIQYANYVSATQLTQWATSANIPVAVTDGWLGKS